MIYQDLYTIILKVDKTEISLDPVEYSLSIHESIHTLYPTATITMRDHTGLFQETLAFSSGLEIEIGFGDTKTINTNKYSINYDHLDKPEFPGYISGDVDLFLIQSSKFKQTIKSVAYKNRISLIVKKIMDTYDFTSLDINDTGNENIWYQSLITDDEFIQTRLLPYAYSNNSGKTPFYSFITNDNVYHFRNYKSMFDTGVECVIEYRIIKGDTGNENTTNELKRWKTDLKSLYKNFNRQIISIDKQTGDLIEDENDSIIDYPLENNLKLPIVNIGNDYTGYIDEDFSYSETGDIESIQGKRIYEQRNSGFIDKFLLLQHFNPKLHAGLSIKLNIYSMNNDKLSTTYAGVYLIEDCEQIWDGEARRAYTKLIVSRKYLNVPNTILLKGKLK